MRQVWVTFVILVSLVCYSQCKICLVCWLQNMFGDQGIIKLNNKKSVQLFVKFLSDLVPHEPAEYLKVTVSKFGSNNVFYVIFYQVHKKVSSL